MRRPSLGIYPICRNGRHKRRCGSYRVEMAASDNHDMSPAVRRNWPITAPDSLSTLRIDVKGGVALQLMELHPVTARLGAIAG
jgi:hypothetical protein